MKQNKPEKDYTSHAFALTIGVIAVLLAVAYIPAQQIGPIKLKRANIVADLIGAEEEPMPMGDAYFDTTFLAETPDPVADSLVPPPADTVVSQTWTLTSDTPESNLAAPQQPVISHEDTLKLIAIEDYDSTGTALAPFYDALREHAHERPVRVGVLGDSFIEGDIITADLREKFQSLFGGIGVGFVPLSSSVAKYRETVHQTSSEWETYNLIQYKSVPDSIKHRFFISGSISIPYEGASTSFKGSKFRKHIAQCAVARLLFINEGHTAIRFTINDSIERVFYPDPAPYVQQIAVKGDIQSVAVSLTQTAGFIGYGMMLEGTNGIAVDNYSVRSNSGLPLLVSSTQINHQINKIAPYDLIILEYGLNVISPDVTDYSAYSRSLCRIIEYIKTCFPDAAILVMGVGDRSTLRDGQFVTMPAVGGMIRAQREAAQKTGVAFWDTFQAMGGEGSMVSFVERKWAAKDYTHIGYAGGRYIARELVRALLSDREIYETQRQAIADSVARVRAIQEVWSTAIDSTDTQISSDSALIQP